MYETKLKQNILSIKAWRIAYYAVMVDLFCFWYFLSPYSGASSTTRTRLEIQADVACVDLRSRCPYFYEFGCKLAPL